jgi:hypothetical protein
VVTPSADEETGAYPGKVVRQSRVMDVPNVFLLALAFISRESEATVFVLVFLAAIRFFSFHRANWCNGEGVAFN